MPRYRERARHNALKRYRPDDDPEVQAAAADLAAGQLEDHIRRVVDEAPPLSAEQRHKLAALLVPAPSTEDAAP